MRRSLGPAVAAALSLLFAGPALACGAMVSSTGAAELGGFEALVVHDGSAENLVVSVAYDGAGGPEGFAWLMPFPEPPHVAEGDLEPFLAARAITEPPRREDHVPEVIPAAEEEGATAVGGGAGVDVLGRATIEGLRFVTLGGGEAAEVARWMTEHRFAFHDRQQPAVQSYLDRGWVLVAARALPGAEASGALMPVRVRFRTSEPLYPLALAGSGHESLRLPMTLFVITGDRPVSATYHQTVVRPDRDGDFPAAGNRLELRYTAPLDRLDATSLGVTPGTWLTRYEAMWEPPDLTDDLVLEPAADQSAVGFGWLLEEYASARRGVYLARGALIAAPILLASGVGGCLVVRRRRRRA